MPGKPYDKVKICRILEKDALKVCFYKKKGGLMRSFEINAVNMTFRVAEMQRKFVMPKTLLGQYLGMITDSDFNIVKGDTQYMNSIFLGQIGRPIIIKR